MHAVNRPTMSVNIVGLEKSYFYFGQGMQKHWVKSRRAFLNYVVNKIGQSAKASLMEGDLVITEIVEDPLPKFKTEEEKKNHLEHWNFGR